MFLYIINGKSPQMERSYNKISLQHFAEQMDAGIIAESEGLVVSKKPTTTHDHAFDFGHPHMIEGIVFVLCVNGHGKIMINLTEYILDSNSILIVLPNNIVQVREQEGLEAEFLFFTFDYISKIKLSKELGGIISTIEKRQSLPIDRDDFQELLLFHRLIVKQYERVGEYREDIIKNLVHTIVLRVLQIYAVSIHSNGSEHFDRQEETYGKFIRLLLEHYRTERTVKFYAGKLYLTPKYFSKVVKHVSGQSASDHINHMVIMAAKSLLKGTDMTIAQISDDLNFANPSFFGTYFKKMTGQTPNQYRK